MSSDTRSPTHSRLIFLEQNVILAIYTILVMVPLVNIALRPLRVSILGIDGYLSHALLIVGFLGAVGTGRERRHLAIGSAEVLPPAIKKYTEPISISVATILLTCLTVSAITMTVIAFGGSGGRIGVIPIVLVIIIVPLSYLLLNVQYITHLPQKKTLIATISLLVGIWFALASIVNFLFIYLDNPPLFLDTLYIIHSSFFAALKIPLIVITIVLAFLGLPLFLVLGGVALILFAAQGTDLSIIPLEGYNMLTSSALPAIPLFTLAGYILSESKASDRLIRVFRNLLGWMPGGLVITAVIASAFFTSFTGASGVTILALGGLLFPILRKEERLSEQYTTGLLTSASNIGLLFPPSLAIILYGTIAQINIFHVFLGGIIPGALILIAFSVVGVAVSLLTRHEKRAAYTFDLKETLQSIKDAIFELLIPVVVLVALFSGFATLVESAAIAALYSFVIAVFIKREIAFRELRHIFNKCAIIIGGVLMILATARGLSFFIIDAQIPIVLSDWVSANISSRFVFLIILNAALLITGCFMDIFSAILIVAPLVIPLGELFGIHPVHLGVIFLANLGVGFITPPVGLDLFLASYRFNKPLRKIYRYIIPFFALEFAMVLIITYVPTISTFLLRFAERGGGY